MMTKTPHMTATRRIILSTVSFLIAAINMCGQSSMKLHMDKDGRYMLDASVNGVGVTTYYTEESWFASLSSTTYLFLYENGYIADADVRGMTTVTMPGGKNTKAGSLVIRNLKIGNVIVKDLPAFVIARQKVPLIVGSSAFDCFGEVTVEDGMLIVHDNIGAAAEPSPQGPDRTDSLRMAIQEQLDAKSYADACRSIEELKTAAPLSMHESYQYIMVLNILGRSDDTIAEAMEWLQDHAGHSSTLDFWIHDALGDSYSRKKLTSKAIASYEKAVETYYGIFNTSESEVRRSSARDETLGVTLFALGQQYAAAGNHKKAVSCCSLAAKCGNAAARAFCDNYKIRY